MNREDERIFLTFLRSAADIVIFVPFAPSPEELVVDDIASHQGWHFNIWNTAFPWKPNYGTTIPSEYGPGGQYYISNASTAPVIEYTRYNASQNTYGRVYWAKYFPAPNGLSYDVSE